MIQSGLQRRARSLPSDSRKVIDRRSTGQNPFVARLKPQQCGERLVAQVGELVGNDSAKAAGRQLSDTCLGEVDVPEHVEDGTGEQFVIALDRRTTERARPSGFPKRWYR